MSPVPADTYAKYLADTQAATAADNTTAIGNALTDYIVTIFQQLDGVEVDTDHTRVFSDDGSQELDVLLWNEMAAGPTGLNFMPHLVFVEAKNWTKKVGSDEVVWFKHKVCEGGPIAMHGSYGILVAPLGVTGNNAQRTDAKNRILTARREATLIVVTPAELAVGAAELRELLKNRVWDLGAGKAGLPD